MANSIGVLDQLTPSHVRPRLYVKRREAIFLIATGQAVWVEEQRTVRKTPKYRRLTADKVIQQQLAPCNPWKIKQSGYAGPLVMQCES